MTKHRLLVVLIAVLLWCEADGRPQNAAASEPYPHTGYVIENGPWLTSDQQDALLSELESKGIQYAHVELDWATAETEKGKFNWTIFDAFFTKLSSHGIKLYLTLEGGVDGTTVSMPAFVSGRSWQIELGPDQDNTLTWNPDENVVTFAYKNQWLFMDWDPVIARGIDILPGERVDYTLRGKWGGSGARSIHLGYNLRGRPDHAWNGSVEDLDSVEFPADGSWLTHTFSVTAPDAPVFDNTVNYLQFKFGMPDQPASNVLVDLDAFRVEFPDRIDPATGLKPYVLTAADFPYVDKAKIRTGYYPWLTPPFKFVDEGQRSFHITDSDADFQRHEADFFRAAITHLEAQPFASAIAAYGPANEPFVGDHSQVDYSESNRTAFATWLKEKKYASIDELNAAWSQGYADFDGVAIPKRPLNSWTLDPVYFSPGTPEAPTTAAWIDFDQFMREQYSFEYLNSRLKTIRETLQSLGKNKATFLKMPPDAVDWGSYIEDNAARFAASEYLDILGVDPYSYLYGHRDRSDIAAIRTVFSGIATIAARYRKQWGIFELGASIPDHAAKEVADLIRYSAAYGPAVVFPFKLVNDWNPWAGYYGLTATAPGPANGYDEVTQALTDIGGRGAALPQADVAILHSTYNKTYNRLLGREGLTSAISDVQDALSDLGVRSTVLYDYELRAHPHLLSWFKAVIVPRLAIARIGCEVALLDTLNRYIAAGGKVIITGEFDRRTSNLAEVNTGSGCAINTNAALSRLPAEIVTAVPPGSDWESHVRFAGDGPFPWRDQAIRIDTGRDDIAPGDPWYHDPQLRLSPKAGAKVLARYQPSGSPAIVGSAPLPGHAIGNVVIIGPRLRFLSGDVDGDGFSNEYDLYFIKSLIGVEWAAFRGGFGYDRYRDYDANNKIDAADVGIWSAFSGDAFNLTAFYRIVLRDWGLLPLEVDQDYRGVIAHLGIDGLAVGNNTDSPNTFRLWLPFKTLPRDPADAKYFPNYPLPGNVIEADVSNILGARQTVFIPLAVPVVGDVDQNACVDQTDVRMITAQLRNPKPSNPACDIDGDGVVTVLDARKAVTMCSKPRCAPCQ